MEKYRVYADPGTGKNPFLPPQFLSKQKTTPVEIILGIPRLVVFLIMFPVYIFASILGAKILTGLLANMLLILLGVKIDKRSNIFCLKTKFINLKISQTKTDWFLVIIALQSIFLSCKASTSSPWSNQLLTERRVLWSLTWPKLKRHFLNSSWDTDFLNPFQSETKTFEIKSQSRRLSKRSRILFQKRKNRFCFLKWRKPTTLWYSKWTTIF